MPATFTPRSSHAETLRKEPGFGGKPPLDKSPTGGGGDGDGDDGLNRRGPRELLQRFRLLLSFALVGDLIFFVSLVSAFFVHQGAVHFDAHDNYISDWRPIPLPFAFWISTGLLLLSSVTVEFGRRQIFREVDVIEEWLGLGRPMGRRTWPWLAATAALGIAFLLSLSAGWRELRAAGFTMRATPDSYFLYVLTGSHAVHILIGLGLLASASFGLYKFRRVEQRQIAVDCIAWYWHAMAALWLGLFGLLAFTR